MFVSVVIPIYNVEEYLNRCIESIVNQTYTNLEIILVDDGSPDKCPQMCDEWAKKDERIKVIHKENGGLSDARNIGTKKATGYYVIYVDSDDYIENSSIETMVKKSDKEDLDVLRADFRLIYEDKKVIVDENRNKITDQIMDGATYFNNVYKAHCYQAAAWLGLYKRQFLIKNNLFFKKGIYHEDELWTPQVLLKAKRVNHICYPFYSYVMREESITNQSNQLKHGIDLINIAEELCKLKFSGICEETWKNFIIGTYYYGVCTGKLYKKSTKHHLSRKFAIKYGITKKNILPTMLFVLNYKLIALRSILLRTKKITKGWKKK